MTSWHAIKCEPDIGVTDAAAGNFDNNLVGARFKSREFTSLKEGAGSL
jgi:hypothetical protein